jgi:hypothetical protein
MSPESRNWNETFNFRETTIYKVGIDTLFMLGCEQINEAFGEPGLKTRRLITICFDMYKVYSLLITSQESEWLRNYINTIKSIVLCISKKDGTRTPYPKLVYPNYILKATATEETIEHKKTDLARTNYSFEIYLNQLMNRIITKEHSDLLKVLPAFASMPILPPQL